MSDEIEASPLTRSNLKWICEFLADLDAPEVTPSEYGTYWLEWEDESGDLLIEIGETKVAILARPKGHKSWYINGRMADE